MPLGAEGVGARERACGRSGRVYPDVVGRRVGLSVVTSCGGRERRRQVARQRHAEPTETQGQRCRAEREPSSEKGGRVLVAIATRTQRA